MSRLTYRFLGSADAILPIEQVIPPSAAILAQRGLPRLDELRSLMTVGTALPPIIVYRCAGQIYIVNGVHRYTLSREMGCKHIPVLFCSDDDFPIRPFTLADYE
jgi:ParB-like chromosome segregation protein Spo0J